MANSPLPDHFCYSKRLCLRPMRIGDGERVHVYRNLADVALFQGWTPASVAEVDDYAEQMSQWPYPAAGKWLQVILTLPEQADTIIGDLAFSIDDEHQAQAELGVALDPAFQKQGYALEAVKALCNYLFSTFKLHRIHVVIDPQNQASRKLFAKAGFRQEGHLRKASLFKGEWVDDIIMAVLASEWTSGAPENS